MSSDDTAPAGGTQASAPAEGECEHMLALGLGEEPVGAVCGQCDLVGSRWVHLRLCLTCGQVGCCDSSPLKHATAHFHESGHPVIRSAEPGEQWRWCYVDQLVSWTGTP